MGFGLVFIGYLFMFSFTPYGFDILPDIVGFGIAFLGVKGLADYGCGWDILKKYFLVLFPASFITFVIQVLGVIKPDTFQIPFWSFIYEAVIFFYNILLFVAIYKIAEDVEMRSIKIKAQRNMIMGVIYFVIGILLKLPVPAVQKVVNLLKTRYAAGALFYLYGYVWLFLNLAVIFSCYMWICAQGDEDMPMKERKQRPKRNEDE